MQRNERTAQAQCEASKSYHILGQSGTLVFTDGWPTNSNAMSQRCDLGGSLPDEWPSAILLKGIYYKNTIFTFLTEKKKIHQFSTPNNKNDQVHVIASKHGCQSPCSPTPSPNQSYYWEQWTKRKNKNSLVTKLLAVIWDHRVVKIIRDYMKVELFATYNWISHSKVRSTGSWRQNEIMEQRSRGVKYDFQKLGIFLSGRVFA